MDPVHSAVRFSPAALEVTAEAAEEDSAVVSEAASVVEEALPAEAVQADKNKKECKLLFCEVYFIAIQRDSLYNKD